jgi:hypothetical protein
MPLRRREAAVIAQRRQFGQRCGHRNLLASSSAFGEVLAQGGGHVRGQFERRAEAAAVVLILRVDHVARGDHEGSDAQVEQEIEVLDPYDR